MRSKGAKEMDQKSWGVLFVAWFIALGATAGSLFFSEVLGFIPCVLCWYQRIAMYPIVIILVMGLLRKDAAATIYSLPLSVIGLAIALYHNLLHWGIVPEDLSPCVQGVPCSTVYINWLGFITIPLLSMLAFIAIATLLTLNVSRYRRPSTHVQ